MCREMCSCTQVSQQLLLEVCVCHARITCVSVCMQYNIQENKALHRLDFRVLQAFYNKLMPSALDHH